MSDNRNRLKQLARGCNGTTDSDAGFDIDLWEYLDHGEYNQRAVEACVGMLRWYRQEHGTIDRQSGFYQYLQEMKKQGHQVEI